MKNVSFLHGLIDTIVERSRSLLEGASDSVIDLDTLLKISRALVAGHGEFSGSLLARQIIKGYKTLDDEAKLAFFQFLAAEFVPDHPKLEASARLYLEHPCPDHLAQLAEDIDGPRQEFFRRLNLTANGARAMVAMRLDLLKNLKSHPELNPVDKDLIHMFGSWFNRGFLVLRRIDWSTSAETLEKIIEYEAVHEISDWSDLKRRLDPVDRRCFAFFHPALMDDPLIFVEVALSQEIPTSIQELLSEETLEKPQNPTTAVFYSISNCQKGLQGISFGNLLIKQVATDLAQEIPSLKNFVTLSPIPRFASWLKNIRENESFGALTPDEIKRLETLEEVDWHQDNDLRSDLAEPLRHLVARYLLSAKSAANQALDPVARFHLGNGARLERINWLGDLSQPGIEKSYGLMVNYLYDLSSVDANHEAYVNDGVIVASNQVTKLLRGKPVAEEHSPAPKQIAS
jgi:malonyl-CoA decarboxylase